MMSRVRPYEGSVVTVAMLLRGYARAFARFQVAAEDDEDVLSATFAPLFEALNWAVVLEDRIRLIWAPEGTSLGWAWRERIRGAEAMGGIRWVRNVVHHQWVDALTVVDANTAGFRRYPVRDHEWVWRDVSALPLADVKKKDPSGESMYHRLLEGHTAEFTLTVLGEAFDEVWRLLERPRFGRDA
jgi:hypothetical protein